MIGAGETSWPVAVETLWLNNSKTVRAPITIMLPRITYGRSALFRLFFIGLVNANEMPGLFTKSNVQPDGCFNDLFFWKRSGLSAR